MLNARARQEWNGVSSAVLEGPEERIAAFDLGSNSFHLLVVDVDEHGRTTIVDQAKQMVRLGAGTLETGTISDESFERALGALRMLHARATAHRPRVCIAVGTSALREASNGADFVNAARAYLGLSVRVIDGIEEARLIYE